MQTLLRSLRICRQLNAKCSRSRDIALIALLPYLTKSDRVSSLQDILTTILNRSNPFRAIALTVLIPYLKEADCLEVAQEAIQEALTTTRSLHGDWWEKTIGIVDECLPNLAPHCRSLPHPCLYPLWRSLLHSISSGRRVPLIQSFEYLAPVIQELGETRPFEDMFHAVQDVTTWWP